ncbi:MAG: hypothetical protein ABI778_03640, partial [Ignavibacteriota bacterium]
MKINYLYIVLIIFFCRGSVLAQPAATDENIHHATPRPAIGGFADVNFNFAHADFSQLPGIPECNAHYQSGFGIGPSLGIFYELPFDNEFSLLLRGAFSVYGEKLISNENVPIAVNGVENAGVIEHSISATLSMIGIQPMVNYQLSSAFAVHLGAEFGVVINSSFSQIESLKEPQSSGVFDNGLRTRNPQSGKIPDANPIIASLLLGASYRLPLNTAGTLQAVPEISYSIGLTPIAQNVSWSVSSLRGGIAIRYEIPERPVVIPPPPRDTIPPPPPPLPMPIASVTAAGVDPNGQELASATLRVEEIYSVKMTPLLPYIFFEEGSENLPSRYSTLSPNSAKDFDEIQLKHSEAMEINHQTLNVIGKRLTDDPKASISLAGITVNRSQTVIEKKLAVSRAETIATYLHSVWHIAASRIRVTSHSLSEQTVGSLDSDGFAEANRVEIT